MFGDDLNAFEAVALPKMLRALLVPIQSTLGA